MGTQLIVQNKKVVALGILSCLLASCAQVEKPEHIKQLEENIALDQKANAVTYDQVTRKYNFNKNIVSLSDAAQMIVLFHPRVFQAKGYENSEGEMVNIAEAAYYPQISGGLDSRRESEPSARYDKKYLQDMSLNIDQVLYDFGKISSAVKSAEYGYLGAKVQTKLTNEELIHISSNAVITANRSKELAILAKQQVASVGSLSKLVEDRHEKGASNLSDVYQAKSRLDDVLSEELDVNSQNQSIIRTLGVIIGQKDIKDAVIGNLPTALDNACSIPPSWEKIPEYQLAQIDAERAIADLEKAKADELPTISFNSRVSRPLNATPRYGSRYDTRIGINVSVPVYQGGALAAGKKVAQSRIESADARRMEIQLDIEQKISEAQVTLDNLHQRTNLLSQRVSNLANTKELYKQQYLELGTRTLLDLLNSEQEYHRAKVDVVNNKFDIVQTQLNCAYDQGKLAEYLGVYTE